MAYNKDKNYFGKVTTGTNAQGKSMIFKTDGPLDDRVALKTVASLISQKALGAKDDNGNYKSGANIKDWIYPAMTCAVQETGEVFVLQNKDKLELLSDNVIENLTDTEIEEKISKAWVKLAKNSDLQDIKNVVSGIFQFKGVATSIDPDHTTLTIGAATVSGSIGVAPNIKQFGNKPLISYGTVLQENLDSVKYAWGTSEYPNLFFTDDLYTTDNIGQPQYKKGAEEDLQYINVFDTLYFYKREELVNYTIPSQEAGGSPTTGTREYKVWEALDKGGILYSLQEGEAKPLSIYTVTSTAELPTALKTGVSVSTYKYYQFTEIADASKYTVKINNSANTVTSVTASTENNGHVYQLGEEEYASNGNMWVQLGSPKTDWIVL